ncbi:MAG: hypothetical protein MJ226_02375 [archaeon]|uniref:hypothetical protein n=1 Tax=Methanobrevibacter TaxID=2172 RepID=UPI00084C683E|nr:MULTISPECIES: hypothetical protein [Methanobrevibacter]MCQ2970407.1 hypothetical protein [archaeon]OED01028.1 hypothetical protein A9505_02495 [Methanobrevibacter sp. A27]
MDYENIIKENFPNYNVEVITPNIFELEKLIEYITDDILIYKPYSIFVYRHLIRFMMNIGLKGKIYYLDGFSDEELKSIHGGLLKFTWAHDVKIKLFENADPDREILGLEK